MKLGYRPTDAARIRAGNTRPPCRTHAELAEEFGISGNALTATMARHPGAPPPNLQKHGYAKATWYPAAEMRAWWARVQAQRVA